MGWKEGLKDFFSAEPPSVKALRGLVIPTATLQVGEKADIERQYDADTEQTFMWVGNFGVLSDDLSPWGSMKRDEDLRILWKKESLLAGAMASMTQKMVSLGWVVSGRKNATRHAARVLYNANDHRGWSDFIAKFTQDFLSQDKGAFVELGRAGQESSRIEAIWNIDSQYMIPRHDAAKPYIFRAPNREAVKVPWEDIFNVSSMPTPIDTFNSLGFCAVSRAAKAAALLIALYKYDADKLSAMPPQGIAAITGMTERQVVDALRKYKTSLEQKDTLVFPGVLWLASMSGEVKVNMTPFSTLPDSFSREEVIQVYVNTLALDFGVDPREFWPATVAGATRADALVQAMKAKGKGPGELIGVTERSLNRRIMPEGVVFKFDFQDDEEDELEATILIARIRAIVALYNDSTQFGNPPLIEKEEARVMLAKLGVIPREFMTDSEEVVSDTGGFRIEKETEVVIEYRNGVLEQTDRTKKFFPVDRSLNGSQVPDLDKLTPLIGKVDHD